MESFLNRYRNITVLLLVIFAQLVLLAIQVKNDQDVRVIRVWAVTMVTPAARVAEWFRGGSIGFIRNYILLKDANEENRKLREEVGRLRIENNFLRNELNTAERAKALQMFQARTQSKMLAANVIGAGGGLNSNVVYVNRGSAEGVMRGMAVVTPDGIVGKVMASYPTAAEVLLITDPDFAAGVISQKSMSRGVLKGQGKSPLCKVEHIPFEDKVEVGEWFYTSGDDRVFPRGFAVGVAKSVKPGPEFKEILVEPSGMQHGLQDVLILLETAHQAIPDTPPTNQPVYIAPPPPSPQQPPPAPSSDPANPNAQPGGGTPPTATGTEADKLLRIYKSVGDSQGHTFGVGGPGAKPADFKNLPSNPLQPGAAPPPASAKPATGTSTGATAPNAAPPAGVKPVPAGGTGSTPSPTKSGSGPTTPNAAPPAGVKPAPAGGSGSTPPPPKSGSGPTTPNATPPAGVKPPAAGSAGAPAQGTAPANRQTGGKASAGGPGGAPRQ